MPQARARVLRATGEGFAERTKPPIVILDSSDEETTINVPHCSDKGRTDVLSPMGSHISDSDTDDSSLHSLKSPQRNSRAERLAKVYDQGTPPFDESDVEIEHDKTKESSPESGENNHGSYSIQCLAARRKELEDELEKVIQEIEQGKARESELTGHLSDIKESIDELKDRVARLSAD